MKIILIIEDNTAIRENICEMLELEDYKIISVANGKNGIALAKTEKPDMILCDIMIPGMNGYEVFNGLSNDIKTAHIHLSFLLQAEKKKKLHSALQWEQRATSCKPFEAQELFGTIASCLNAE